MCTALSSSIVRFIAPALIGRFIALDIVVRFIALIIAVRFIAPVIMVVFIYIPRPLALSIAVRGNTI